MYKLFALCTFLAPWLLKAQNTEGLVNYTETVQVRIQLPPDASEEMKKMVPPSRSAQQVLLFNDKACLYRDASESENEDINVAGEAAGGANIQIKMVRPENKLYRDLENNTAIESREFMGRFFLIKDAPKVSKWKITPEQKDILGYHCQKAILQDTSRKLEAWFTPQIPLSLGPAGYADLPGLILEINIDKGQTTIVANKVEFKSLDKKAIEKPTKGKGCTRAEYDKIVADKMKEMNAEGGGGGMRVIIRN